MHLRLAITCLILAPLLMQCAGEPSLLTTNVTMSTSDAKAAAGLISQYRAAHGLAAVTVDPTLNRAAEVQARAVAQTGILSHGQFASRMSSFGIGGAAAENLTAGSRSVDAAIARWKGSPGHNRNLLMPEARRIGLARATTPGTGYEHYWALVLSQ
jgi:uncharacterized protein YkwD